MKEIVLRTKEIAFSLSFLVIPVLGTAMIRTAYYSYIAPDPAVTKTLPTPSPLQLATPNPKATPKPTAAPRPTTPQIGMDINDFPRICGVADDISSLETADYEARSYYYKLRDDTKCRGLYTFVNSKLESISR